MNYRVVARYLGVVAILIGASMTLSLPWAHPALGASDAFEWRGFTALVTAVIVACACGAILVCVSSGSSGSLLRKETLAIVGLSWILATVLGALPYLLIEPHPMSGGLQFEEIVDALFESASGFTGTGATVFGDVEDPAVMPRSILFWRQETHFLGGLGIMVLFVAILGHGNPGKRLMQAEMTGPLPPEQHRRMQHTAWTFAFIYLGLNVVLTTLLIGQGMSVYDAIGHSFATIATGGFSTYNDSLAHFDDVGIEATVTVFMVLACTNFFLLARLIRLQPGPLAKDVEFRTYLGILVTATVLVIVTGLGHQDFESLGGALRYSAFQVVSIQTNTGLATRDFDHWNQTARSLLFVLMFVGGCAGSTSCSIKVIRYVLLAKILRIEMEESFRPNVVRRARLHGQPVNPASAERGVFIYIALFASLFVAGWLTLLALEPDSIWTRAGRPPDQKALDCASAVAATINGVGPGFGVIGPTRNYDIFTPAGKLLLVVLMLAGRLEIYPVLLLLAPAFWRSM